MAGKVLLFVVQGLVGYQTMKIPSVPHLASRENVRDRRSCIRTPIPMKLRPTRSARRARRSYLTAVTFRQHFSATLKIIRLLYKRGFSFHWLRLVSRWLRRCSGESRCRKVVCRGGKGAVSHPIRE